MRDNEVMLHGSYVRGRWHFPSQRESSCGQISAPSRCVVVRGEHFLKENGHGWPFTKGVNFASIEVLVQLTTAVAKRSFADDILEGTDADIRMDP
jgi:hypothetical protein